MIKVFGINTWIITRFYFSQDDLHRAYNEIYALKNLGHQHISKMYEVFETKEFIYLVIEVSESNDSM